MVTKIWGFLYPRLPPPHSTLTPPQRAANNQVDESGFCRPSCFPPACLQRGCTLACLPRSLRVSGAAPGRSPAFAQSAHVQVRHLLERELERQQAFPLQLEATLFSSQAGVQRPMPLETACLTPQLALISEGERGHFASPLL